MARLALLLALALLAGCSGGTDEELPRAADAPPCESPGTWARSADAAWLHRTVELVGFRVTGCTGSAWIVRGRTSFYLWTTPAGGSDAGVRRAWRAQDLTIWLEPGPRRGEPFPPRGELSLLQLATERLPRRYERLELMPMPPEPLRQCRSSALLRRACPRLLPRVPGWNAYPSYGNPVEATFGIERGGEHPRIPELNRPPAMLHLELSAGDVDAPGLPFAWPSGRVEARNGLVRKRREAPLPLGTRIWGGRRGQLVLAPSYPLGGSQGNHLVFRWRARGVTYVVGLHAWEPFLETVDTLERVVESI